ncbi:hypothetical protein [Neisseria wadsworthii]|uniref:Uncharacterized protein n=1 Tax=Neisseria wadsworthii 9715 TaxID=1030841 RepID=G4CPJ9_9NEIS|nr:hypothetical protein [Neisseria wadsworthii]EGZ47762.1 hypothetical protein HMPREF9370_1009 [Neisseria wadsworthii 9715]QMT34811.1 hypothetical protein H3L96_06915 [Neisseria wadsworthii]
MTNWDLEKIKERVEAMKEIAIGEVMKKYKDWLAVAPAMNGLIRECLSENAGVRLAAFNAYAYPAVVVETDSDEGEIAAERVMRGWCEKEGFRVSRGAASYERKSNAVCYVFRKPLDDGDQYFLVRLVRK